MYFLNNLNNCVYTAYEIFGFQFSLTEEGQQIERVGASVEISES